MLLGQQAAMSSRPIAVTPVLTREELTAQLRCTLLTSCLRNSETGRETAEFWPATKPHYPLFVKSYIVTNAPWPHMHQALCTLAF